MVFVDLEIAYAAQKAFDELVGGLYGVESVEGDRVHDAGIMCVEGDDIVYTHADKLLQRDGAVKGFSGGALVLAALVEIGHDHGDPASLATDGSDHSFEVLVVVVGRHVICDPEHFVGFAVVDYICEKIEVHAAHGLCKYAFSFSGTETGKIAVNDVRGALITYVSERILVLALAFLSPPSEIVIDLGCHFSASLDRNYAQ